MKLKDKDITELIEAGVKDFNLTHEQSEKRCNALIQAVDAGMFDGIPETGPSDFMQHLFVNTKIAQYMTTHVD